MATIVMVGMLAVAFVCFAVILVAALLQGRD